MTSAARWWGEVRCTRCKCRWKTYGELVKWGARCPKITGKALNPNPRNKPSHSEFSGRETDPASRATQAPLL